MLPEQSEVLARILPKSENAGLVLPVLVAISIVGSAIFGLIYSPQNALVPIIGLPLAIVYYCLWFRRPIYIFLLLQRNARRPDRPLVWCSQGKLTVLDSHLFSAPLAGVSVEEVEEDGGRVRHVRFIGKDAQATIWGGYFEPTADDFIERFCKLRTEAGMPAFTDVR